MRNISATGYEIHAGETTGAATSDDGLVWGSYVHGLFADDEFRNNLFKINSNYNYRQHVQKILDDWADVLEENINIEQLLKLAK